MTDIVKAANHNEMEFEMAPAALKIIEERTFSANLDGAAVGGLSIESEWEGLTKFKRADGGHLIVLMAEARIVTGSPALLSMLGAGATIDNDFVLVPARTLPGGLFVPAYWFAKCPASMVDGKLVHDMSAKPWVSQSHDEAMAACDSAGYQLARESQELSIRADICEQDINWTGGKVGAGKVYQGLHLGSVSSAQSADYVSCNSLERSWHQLSTGERVYGLAGNIWTRTFDDVQGDARGLIAKRFAADSPSIAAAPYPSMSHGMGSRPDAGADWSGYALLRGGRWYDGGDAGVFGLGYDSPGYRVGRVGVRCTKPVSDSDPRFLATA